MIVISNYTTQVNELWGQLATTFAGQEQVLDFQARIIFFSIAYPFRLHLRLAA